MSGYSGNQLPELQDSDNEPIIKLEEPLPLDTLDDDPELIAHIHAKGREVSLDQLDRNPVMQILSQQD